VRGRPLLLDSSAQSVQGLSVLVSRQRPWKRSEGKGSKTLNVNPPTRTVNLENAFGDGGCGAWRADGACLRADARCYWIHLPKRMESGSDPRSSCSDLVTRHVRDQLKIFKTLSAEKWLKSRPKSGLDCLIRAGFAKKQFFVGRRKLRPRCISEMAKYGDPL